MCCVNYLSRQFRCLARQEIHIILIHEFKFGCNVLETTGNIIKTYSDERKQRKNYLKNYILVMILASKISKFVEIHR